MLKILAVRQDGTKVLLETWHNPNKLMGFLEQGLNSGEFTDYDVVL